MDIFYNLHYIKNKREFLEDCIRQSYKIKCDELDCYKSFHRIKTDKSTDEILDITNKSGYNHWVFIIRDRDFITGKRYIEAGVTTIENRIDYFIWAYINLEKLDYFVDKYDLETINEQNND